MSDVTIAIEGASPMHGYLRAPEGGGRRPAVIVGHELFGVNPDIRAVVDRLAGLGYVALAPELYHRHAAPGEWLERNDAGRKKGFELLGKVSRDEAVSSVRGAMRYLEGRDDVDGNIGMLGFSAGGHIAFLAACRLPLRATAVLYGGWLTGGDLPIAGPVPTLDEAAGIARQGGKLLFAVGSKDTLINASQVAEIEQKLSAAGVDHQVVVYPEAQHAFFWEDAPSFHRASRDAAWKQIEGFFSRALVA